MNALWREERQLRPVLASRLDGVVAIENLAYEFPWTRGNFVDSLAAGYPMWGLHGADSNLLGYYVAMQGVDEMHLLNLTVHPAHQGRGHAIYMLDALQRLCRERHVPKLWLEVRVSNTRAHRIYLRYGFVAVGRRPNYYPASGGRREDAIVMSLDVLPGPPRHVV